MTDITYHTGTMTSEQEQALPDTDFVFAVRLPQAGEPVALRVTVLSSSARQTEEVALRAGVTVPQLSDQKLVALTMPDGTMRYCTGGAGKWFWIGLAATDA